MKPGLEWDAVFNILLLVTVVSMMTERALAVIFESRRFIDAANMKGSKELICVFVGVVVCLYWRIDAMSVVSPLKGVTDAGMLLTGLIVAGGSKASIKLFQDVLGVKSGARIEYEEKKKQGSQPAQQQPTNAAQAAGNAAANVNAD